MQSSLEISAQSICFPSIVNATLQWLSGPLAIIASPSHNIQCQCIRCLCKRIPIFTIQLKIHLNLLLWLLHTLCEIWNSHVCAFECVECFLCEKKRARWAHQAQRFSDSQTTSTLTIWTKFFFFSPLFHKFTVDITCTYTVANTVLDTYTRSHTHTHTPIMHGVEFFPIFSSVFWQCEFAAPAVVFWCVLTAPCCVCVAFACIRSVDYGSSCLYLRWAIRTHSFIHTERVRTKYTRLRCAKRVVPRTNTCTHTHTTHTQTHLHAVTQTLFSQCVYCARERILCVARSLFKCHWHIHAQLLTLTQTCQTAPKKEKPFWAHDFCCIHYIYRLAVSRMHLAADAKFSPVYFFRLSSKSTGHVWPIDRLLKSVNNECSWTGLQEHQFTSFALRDFTWANTVRSTVFFRECFLSCPKRSVHAIFPTNYGT